MGLDACQTQVGFVDPGQPLDVRQQDLSPPAFELDVLAGYESDDNRRAPVQIFPSQEFEVERPLMSGIISRRPSLESVTPRRHPRRSYLFLKLFTGHVFRELGFLLAGVLIRERDADSG